MAGPPQQESAAISAGFQRRVLGWLSEEHETMSFWQKVQRGVTQAAEEAGKQTSIARKNLEISGLKGDVRRKTNELGDAALELVRSGAVAHERLAALAAEITGIEGKIELAEREIETIQRDGAPTADHGNQPTAAPAGAAAAAAGRS